MTSEQEALQRKAYSSLAAARLLANQKYYDFSISPTNTLHHAKI
jgi:hypothetical protein